MHGPFFGAMLSVIERELRKARKFVLINRSVVGLEGYCISLNNEYRSYMASRYLLQMGHRDIVYISGPLDWSDAR